MDTQTNRTDTICRVMAVAAIAIIIGLVFGLPQPTVAQCATEQIVFDFESGQLGDWGGQSASVGAGYNSTYGVEVAAGTGIFGNMELDETEVQTLFGGYPIILSLESMYITDAPSAILQIQPQFEYVNGSTSSQLYAESGSWTSLQLAGNGQPVGNIAITVIASSGYGIGKFDNVIIEYCSMATPTPSTTPTTTPTPYPTILPSSTPMPTFTPVATWLPNPANGLGLIDPLPTPWQVAPTNTLNFGTNTWENIEYTVSVARGVLVMVQRAASYKIAMVFSIMFIALHMIAKGSTNRRHAPPSSFGLDDVNRK